MNEPQRWAVGFFILTAGLGAASAPVHGVSFISGLVVGLLTYLLAGVCAALIFWMVEGVEGIRDAVSALSEGVR